MYRILIMPSGISYPEIVAKTVNYETVSDSVKFKHTSYPWSIKQAEFDFMYDYITQNNLKRGYEMATGCGISSLAIGLAMKATGGKLMTMDAYIEQTHGYNENTPRTVYYETQAYRTISELMHTFDLDNTVSLVVGWSPDDVSQELSKVYDLRTEKLDFVFIDACHTNKAVIKDMEAVLPYVADGCTFFFHDLEIGDGITTVFRDYLQQKFGRTYEIVVPQPHGYNLGMFKL